MTAAEEQYRLWNDTGRLEKDDCSTDHCGKRGRGAEENEAVKLRYVNKMVNVTGPRITYRDDCS